MLPGPRGRYQHSGTASSPRPSFHTRDKSAAEQVTPAHQGTSSDGLMRRESPAVRWPRREDSDRHKRSARSDTSPQARARLCGKASQLAVYQKLKPRNSIRPSHRCPYIVGRASAPALPPSPPPVDSQHPPHYTNKLSAYDSRLSLRSPFQPTHSQSSPPLHSPVAKT
jgi:hypothetical protein